MRWFRILVPALLIVAWLAAGAVGGPLFGRVSEVASNDATSFLPSDAAATEVQRTLGDFLGADVIPAVVVITSNDPMSADATAAVQRVVGTLADVPGVVETSPALASADGKAMEVFVSLAADQEPKEGVAALNRALNAGFDPLPADLGVRHYVTGPAGFSADLSDAFAGIDLLLLGVALGAVVLILFIVYRAPLLAFVVFLTAILALCAALAVVWVLAREGVIALNGQTQGILFILVIGAATDYGLLYVARFREELRRHPDRRSATVAAWRGSFEPILASGGTVIAGLLCLLLSDLQSNRDLGPIASIGIAFSMLSAFTLLPALLYVAGRTVYWPRVPQHDPSYAVDAVPEKGIWARLPRLVERHPRRLWVAAAGLLAVASVGLIGFKADGVAQSDLVLGDSAARTGQQMLAQHFPAGSGSPAYLLVANADKDRVARIVAQHPGVVSLAAVSDAGHGGTVGWGGDDRRGRFQGDLRVIDAQVLLQATLRDAFDSPEAAQTVTELRAAVGPEVKIGGETATEVDTAVASTHDRNLIIPVVLVVIALILAALLRSLIAPIVLILTTVLSFGATLGISALVFNHLFDFAGADPALPLFAFVFLVALGIDYNIFLMTRVREEALEHGPRAGIGRGLAITGGVITSAGLVLAATFAALAVIPILFLAQIAFIVGFGVLLDTFVVRTVLVPALADELGRWFWWPSALSRRD